MQPKNKNDSVQLSSRYQQYMFTKRHLREQSSRKVFPIRSSNEEFIGETDKQRCSNTLTGRSAGGQNRRGNYIGELVVKKVIGKVKVRKNIVNVEKLKKVLREHKLPHTIQEISKATKVLKTTAEHWFRNDNCFAIPDAEIWFQLKEFLKIKTDEFDKSITEFEIRDNKFDMANRVYQKEGIAPTLTTLTGGQQHSIVDDGYSIRRLTPKECERLQGFPDDWTKDGVNEKGEEVSISDSQRYKSLGNAVTVNVIKAIMKKLI